MSRTGLLLVRTGKGGGRFFNCANRNGFVPFTTGSGKVTCTHHYKARGSWKLAFLVLQLREFTKSNFYVYFKRMFWHIQVKEVNHRDECKYEEFEALSNRNLLLSLTLAIFAHNNHQF